MGSTVEGSRIVLGEDEGSILIQFIADIKWRFRQVDTSFKLTDKLGEVDEFILLAPEEE